MTDQNNAVLTDNQIEALAKKHIAPHADRLDAIMANPVPYQQTEQFRRVKALINDVLSKLRAPVANERAVPIPVPFCVDTTHKNQAFVTLGFNDEATRKEFVRAVCHGGFRVPTDALASAPVADTPRVDELMAKWDDDGATRGPAFIELRDLAWELERCAAPQASDTEIMAIVREQCPDFDHDGPSEDGMIAIARTLLSRYGAPAALVAGEPAGFSVELSPELEDQFSKWVAATIMTPWQRSVARLAFLLNCTNRGLIDYGAAQHFANELMSRTARASAPVGPQACPTDVCQAAKADGVLCADGECDRANGVRNAAPLPIIDLKKHGVLIDAVIHGAVWVSAEQSHQMNNVRIIADGTRPPVIDLGKTGWMHGATIHGAVIVRGERDEQFRGNDVTNQQPTKGMQCLSS